METFGAGNAPQRSDLIKALRDACDRGVVIVAISQCPNGSVSNAYETGQALLQAGVVPGGDMTPEVSPLLSALCLHTHVHLLHNSAPSRNWAIFFPNPSYPLRMSVSSLALLFVVNSHDSPAQCSVNLQLIKISKTSRVFWLNLDVSLAHRLSFLSL